MRFMMMHKTESKWEAGVLPSPELMAGVGKLIEEMTKAGVLLPAEGLRPSSLGPYGARIDNLLSMVVF